jgi:hypothetical protein
MTRPLRLVLLLSAFLAGIAAGMSLSGCAEDGGKSWRTEDTKRELLYAIPAVIDYFQTRDIIANPETYREKNVILGDHPSMGRLNAFSAIALGGHYLISRHLNHHNRKLWQYSTGTVATLNIARNHFVVGLRMNFK